MNIEDARIIDTLAKQEPAFEQLSMEYSHELSAESVPEDFAENTLNLLRSSPDMERRIKEIEKKLPNVQTFDLGGFSMNIVLVAALIVLLKPHMHFNAEWDFKHFKGALKINTSSINDKMLKPIFSVLSTAAKKASEALDSVAKAMDQDVDNEKSSQGK